VKINFKINFNLNVHFNSLHVDDAPEDVEVNAETCRTRNRIFYLNVCLTVNNKFCMMVVVKSNYN
jgi:hypothetical protein